MAHIPRREVLRKGWLGAIGVAVAGAAAAVMPELSARAASGQPRRAVRSDSSSSPYYYDNTVGRTWDNVAPTGTFLLDR